jgi:hypothetical protein
MLKSAAVAFVFLLAVSLSASCADEAADVALIQAPADAPAAFPFDIYRNAAERGEVVYAIDAGASTAFVQVSRAGLLARFGHDHVVASHDVYGYVLRPDPAGTLSGARADLYLPLATLAVDETELREAVGLTTDPSAKDIEGTKTNMYKTLDVEAHPGLTVNVLMISEDALFTNLTLHGVRQSYRIPVDINFDENTLQVSGEFTLLQTDHGIKPFRALGGTLAVSDELVVRFEIIARR